MAEPEIAVSTTNWLKQHWKEAAIGAAATLAAIWYLFLRGPGSNSGNSGGTKVSPLSYANTDVGGQQQAAQSAVAQDTQIGQTAVGNLAQQLLDKMSQSSQAELDALNQAASATNAQFAQNQQAEQQAQQGFLSTVQGLLAQITQQGQQSLSGIQAEEASFKASMDSILRAQGTIPSGATTAAAGAVAQGAQDVASWAKGLGIDVSVAQAYVNAHNGQFAPNIDALNNWLSANHIDPTKSIAANQYKAQQGAGYQAGSQPATASSPAGGGLWKGQTDQQIAQLFQATYGNNWQQVWNQQHAAGG